MHTPTSYIYAACWPKLLLAATMFKPLSIHLIYPLWFKHVQQLLQQLTKAVNGLFIDITCFNRVRRTVYPNGKFSVLSPGPWGGHCLPRPQHLLQGLQGGLLIRTCKYQSKIKRAQFNMQRLTESCKLINVCPINVY
jgi:hypothetical protein